MFFLLLSLSLAAITPRSVRAITFVGCVSSADTYISEESYAPSNSQACEQYCIAAGKGYSYSYFIAEDMFSDSGSSCRCGTTTLATFFQPGTSSGPGCYPEDAYISKLETSFSFDTCAREPPADAAYLAPTDRFNSLSDCFDYGKSYRFMYVRPSDNGYECYASNNQQFVPVPATCDKWITFAYNHPSGAVQSQLPRKKRALALRAEQFRLQNTLCPAGLTACNVPGADNAYECLDIYTELESCGGCMAGEYGSDDKHMGVDCTRLPHHAFSSPFTCSAGRCIDISARWYGEGTIRLS